MIEKWFLFIFNKVKEKIEEKFNKISGRGKINILCLNCFDKFLINETLFKCREDNCWNEFTPPEYKNPNCFKILKKAKCNKCRHETSDRICPKCRKLLPTNAGEIAEEIIAILGDTGSGKSHYFTVLHNQIERQLAKAFQFWIVSADEEAIKERFIKNYHDPLYVWPERKVIPATQKGQKNKFTFRLGGFQSGNSKQKSIYLIFYDISGEDLKRIRSMDKVARYIQHASGLIYLIDPKQLPSIYDRSNKKEKRDAPHKILSNILESFESNNRIKTDGMIDMPVAICLSKIDDSIKDLFSHQSKIFRPSVLINRFKEEEAKEISAEIESALNDEIPVLVSLCRSRLKDYIFSGISSLGSSPDEKGVIHQAVAPIRVEDPFLFILHNKGYINKEETSVAEAEEKGGVE